VPLLPVFVTKVEPFASAVSKAVRPGPNDKSWRRGRREGGPVMDGGYDGDVEGLQAVSAPFTLCPDHVRPLLGQDVIRVGNECGVVRLGRRRRVEHLEPTNRPTTTDPKPKVRGRRPSPWYEDKEEEGAYAEGVRVAVEVGGLRALGHDDDELLDLHPPFGAPIAVLPLSHATQTDGGDR
jgi:hypothetical protein